MARTNLTKTNKTKMLIAILLACALIGVSLFFVLSSLLKPVNDETKEPTFSYSQPDGSLGELTNSSFAYGTVGAKLNSYPRTSVSGWKLTKSSSAKSGVVNTSDTAWNKLMEAFYSDPGLLNYVKAKEGLFDSNAIQKATKDYFASKNVTIDGDPTNEQVTQYFTEAIFPKYFANPGVHTDAHTQTLEDKVYMLNNYKTGETGSGSAQKLVANKEITLDKGAFAKVSVWVKTINLDQLSANTVGANVYVTNSFGDNAQAPYGYFNIDTDGEWQNFTFFIQADKTYTTKFTLVLGLGYENEYSEGTVFFDDIIVEKLDTVDATLLDTNAQTTFEFGSDNEVYVAKQAVQGKYPLYKLTLNIDEITAIGGKYFNPMIFNSFGYTVDEGILGNKFGTASYTDLTQNELEGCAATSGKKITLDRASYTVEFNSYDLSSEEYAYVSFFIKNKLNDFYATKITINVIDEFGSIVQTRASVAEILEASDEWVNCGLLIKNNFDKDVYTEDRTFTIQIVIGPTDLKSDKNFDYAVGDVYITTPVVAEGCTYKYANDADEKNDVATENYSFYQFFSNNAKGSSPLHAGYESDYIESVEDQPSYSLTVAPSDIGAIKNNPAIPQNYKGVVADHYYIKEGSTNYEIDTLETAGVVNSKYIANYTIPGIDKALIKNNGEDIQPLMIYNATASNYGYISSPYSVNANSFAKVTLNVRVYGGAEAYIYLVDVSDLTKTVMSFKDFTVNTDNNFTTKYVGDTVVGQDYKFQLKVTEDMLDSNGWASISFYIATGVSSKSFRLEMWNGDRTALTPSNGFALFNDIQIISTAAFTEAEEWENTFTVDDNPLYKIGHEDLSELIAYTYDNETADDKNDDITSYVWAKNDNFIYAVFKTLEPMEKADVDEDKPETETPEESTASPADFWLQFSSIVLVVVLILAIIALFIKNTLRRRKANRNDAVSHYNVVSRAKTNAKSKTKAVVDEQVEDEVVDEEEIIEDEIEEEVVEETTEEQPASEEQSLDEFVYGEVQNFGDEEQPSDDKTNE